MSEIIFEVREDEIDGRFTASALGFDIFTESESMDGLRQMVREAVQCHFFDLPIESRPKIIRLHVTRDEVLAAREFRATSPGRSWSRRLGAWATRFHDKKVRISGYPHRRMGSIM